jgi:hypothetical protein
VLNVGGNLSYCKQLVKEARDLPMDYRKMTLLVAVYYF